MRLKAVARHFVFLYFCLPPALPGASVTSTWVGTVSTDWNAPGNWSPGTTAPNNGTDLFSVVVTNASNSLTHFPAIATATSDTVSNLTLGTNTSLQINGALTLAAAAGNANLLSNAGSISIGSAGTLNLTGANQTVTFDGNGTLTLAVTTPLQGVIGKSSGLTLVNNAEHTIQGYGNIQQGTGTMTVTNHGLISANVSGQILGLGPLKSAGTTNNDGTLMATNGGTLQYFGTLNNAGGTVSADGGNVYIGTSTLSSGSATGGTFDALHNGSLFFNGFQKDITVNLTNGSASVQSQTVSNGSFTLNGVSTLTLGNTVQTEGISGTIQNNSGSTVNVSGFANLSGTLSNAAGGQVNVSSVARASGLSLNNDGDLSIQGVAGQLFITDSAFTFGGTGTVTMASSSALITGQQVMTLTNNNAVQGQGRISGVGGNLSTLLNQGSVTANSAGGTLTLQQMNVTNNGTLSASNGGTLELHNGSVTNTGGTISANGGSITMLASVNGGSINAMNNGAITVASSVGGASIHLTSGGTLLSNGHFTNTSAFVSGANSKLNLAGGSTYNGFIDAGSGGLLQTDDTASFAGNITVESGGNMTVNQFLLTGSSGITDDGAIAVNGLFQNRDGAALTFGGTGTLTLAGGTLSNGGSNSTGVIMNQAGHTITGSGTIQNGGFVNNGNLNILAGGAISDQTAGNLNPHTTFDNYGSITAGGQLLAGSNIALNFNNGGTVKLNGGTIGSVAGATGTSAVNNAGSTIQGNGTISTASFTNNGNLAVDAGGQVAITSNLTNINNQSLAGGSYDVSGTLKINGAALTSNYAELTLDGASAHVTDLNGNDALKTLILNGSGGVYIFENGASESVFGMTNSGKMVIGEGSSFSSGSIFTQQAGETEVNGTLHASLVAVNGGALSGTGTVNGTVQVASGGTLAPGDDPGQLTVNGDLNEDAGGNIEIEIASGSSYDQLFVSGNARLNGTLTLILLDGFVPTDGEAFRLLTWGSNTGGTFFSNLVLPSLSGEYVTFSSEANSLFATFHTPEPGTLFAGIVALAIALARSRGRGVFALPGKRGSESRQSQQRP